MLRRLHLPAGCRCILCRLRSLLRLLLRCRLLALRSAARVDPPAGVAHQLAASPCIWWWGGIGWDHGQQHNRRSGKPQRSPVHRSSLRCSADVKPAAPGRTHPRAAAPPAPPSPSRAWSGPQLSAREQRTIDCNIINTRHSRLCRRACHAARPRGVTTHRRNTAARPSLQHPPAEPPLNPHLLPVGRMVQRAAAVGSRRRARRQQRRQRDGARVQRRRHVGVHPAHAQPAQACKSRHTRRDDASKCRQQQKRVGDSSEQAGGAEGARSRPISR